MLDTGKISPTPALWKLILLNSIASFCGLFPADATPAVAHYFQVSPGHAAGIITYYLFGYGLGPLLYGPMANRYGRKKTLFIGLTVAFVGMIISFASIPCHLFYGLLIGRIIGGVGASSGLVLGMLIIKETTTATEARRIFSFVILFFAFSPSLALGLGGALLTHFGLNSVFLAMPILVLIVIGMVFTLEETYHGERINIEIRKSAMQYLLAYKNKTFIFITLIVTAATAIAYVFNSLSPVIAVDTLHISPELYGELAIIPSLGLFAGALLSSKLSKIYSAPKSIKLGIGFSIIGALCMFIAFLFQAVNLFTMLMPAFLVFAGAAIIIPNATMSAIDSANDPAIASAVISATPLILSSLLVAISSVFLQSSLIVLPASLLLLMLLAGGLVKITVFDFL